MYSSPVFRIRGASKIAALRNLANQVELAVYSYCGARKMEEEAVLSLVIHMSEDNPRLTPLRRLKRAAFQICTQLLLPPSSSKVSLTPQKTAGDQRHTTSKSNARTCRPYAVAKITQIRRQLWLGHEAQKVPAPHSRMNGYLRSSSLETNYTEGIRGLTQKVHIPVSVHLIFQSFPPSFSFLCLVLVSIGKLWCSIRPYRYKTKLTYSNTSKYLDL